MSENKEELSSSDEDDERLREALDPHMFSAGRSAPAENRDTTGRANYRENVLNVTPEFQSFVAKRLSDILDKTIKERRQKDFGFEPDPSSGIRLFSDSKRVLKSRKFADPYVECDTKSDVAVRKQRRPKPKNRCSKGGENEVDESEKVRQASVSAEWILNGEAIRGWCKPKSTVFAYRKNEKGVLVETKDPPYKF